MWQRGNAHFNPVKSENFALLDPSEWVVWAIWVSLWAAWTVPPLRCYPRRASRAAPTKNLQHFLNNPSVPIGKGHSVLQRKFRLFIRSGTYGTMRAMAHPRKSHEHDSTNGAVPGGRSDKDASEKEILIAGAIPITVAILITGFLHRARLHIMLRIVMAAALRLLRKIILMQRNFGARLKTKLTMAGKNQPFVFAFSPSSTSRRMASERPGSSS